MKLGENIKTIRKKWGENQDDFSARFGMKRSNLSKIETGEIELSLSNCRLLSELTGININRLIDEELTLDDIPPLPIGEGGEMFVKKEDKKAEAAEREPGEFEDIKSLSAAVKELQEDMGSLRKLEAAMNDKENEQVKVLKALFLVIDYLEKDMEESEYKEEKKVHLDRLAAILSGE